MAGLNRRRTSKTMLIRLYIWLPLKKSCLYTAYPLLPRSSRPYTKFISPIWGLFKSVKLGCFNYKLVFSGASIKNLILSLRYSTCLIGQSPNNDFRGSTVRHYRPIRGQFKITIVTTITIVKIMGNLDQKTIKNLAIRLQEWST